MRRRRWAESLPKALERGRARFEKWRQTRTRRRIPEGLWSEAVKLAGAHGVHRTASALRLNEQSLRMRAKQSTSAATESGPAFVELPAMAMTSPAEVVVVVERPGGARMRIELGRGAGVDIGGLARGFLEGGE